MKSQTPLQCIYAGALATQSPPLHIIFARRCLYRHATQILFVPSSKSSSYHPPNPLRLVPPTFLTYSDRWNSILRLQNNLSNDFTSMSNFKIDLWNGFRQMHGLPRTCSYCAKCICRDSTGNILCNVLHFSSYINHISSHPSSVCE